jgi:hypothetical protein
MLIQGQVLDHMDRTPKEIYSEAYLMVIFTRNGLSVNPITKKFPPVAVRAAVACGLDAI